MHGGLSTPPPLPGEDAVFAALDRRLSRDTAAPVAVALSGGGDSLALLRLAAVWGDRAGRPLLSLTVDHGLNPESPAWTAFCAVRAAESGASFRALRWEGDKPATGLPAAARMARHALLAVAAREAGAAVILLGHTADDVEETNLMREGDARGIGRLRDWSPSPVWPQGRGVMLLRPMLGARRADLRNWLTARAETWLDDPANEDRRYARVRARAALSPSLIDGGGAGSEDTFDTAAEVGDPPFSREGSAQLVDGGGLRLPAEAFRGPQAAHLLSVAVLCAGGGSRPPRKADVVRLLARLRQGEASAATLAGARIEHRGEHVLFRREAGDAARNPRPAVDGVVDGRFIPTDGGSQWLTLDRLRAATFQIDREADLNP